MAIANRVIDEKTCPRCSGAGRLPIWLAPPPCTPECVKTLREYPQQERGETVMYWLCDVHNGSVPTLWRVSERKRCLEACKGE